MANRASIWGRLNQYQENNLNPKDHVLREVVNSLRDIAVEFHGAGQLRERLRAALAPLLEHSPPAAVQKPFMFAIMGPDGTAHIEENCVSSDGSQLTHELNCLNDSPDTGYSIVPVYISVSAPASQDDAKDAERWRWLISQSTLSRPSADGPGCPTVFLSADIWNKEPHKSAAIRITEQIDAAIAGGKAGT